MSVAGPQPATTAPVKPSSGTQVSRISRDMTGRRSRLCENFLYEIKGGPLRRAARATRPGPGTRPAAGAYTFGPAPAVAARRAARRQDAANPRLGLTRSTDLICSRNVVSPTTKGVSGATLRRIISVGSVKDNADDQPGDRALVFVLVGPPKKRGWFTPNGDADLMQIRTTST